MTWDRCVKPQVWVDRVIRPNDTLTVPLKNTRRTTTPPKPMFTRPWSDLAGPLLNDVGGLVAQKLVAVVLQAGAV